MENIVSILSDTRSDTLTLVLEGIMCAICVIIFFQGWTLRRRTFLNGTRQSVMLTERTQLTHNTVRLCFKLPGSTTLGLPVGKHLKLFAPNRTGVVATKWNGKDYVECGSEIERRYTPVTTAHDVARFELVVKVRHIQKHRCATPRDKVVDWFFVC